VTHHDKSDQVWMVVDRPVGVRDAVAEFPALVDTAGRFGSCVAADPAREAELLEEALHPGEVLTLVRIYFGVRSLEIGIGQNCGRSVSRPRDVDYVQVVFVDQAVEVNVGETLARVRAPMAEQPWLRLSHRKWL